MGPFSFISYIAALGAIEQYSADQRKNQSVVKQPFAKQPVVGNHDLLVEQKSKPRFKLLLTKD